MHAVHHDRRALGLDDGRNVQAVPLSCRRLPYSVVQVPTGSVPVPSSTTLTPRSVVSCGALTVPPLRAVKDE